MAEGDEFDDELAWALDEAVDDEAVAEDHWRRLGTEGRRQWHETALEALVGQGAQLLAAARRDPARRATIVADLAVHLSDLRASLAMLCDPGYPAQSANQHIGWARLGIGELVLRVLRAEESAGG